MSRDNAIPVAKGGTAYNGRTIDSSNLAFADLLGMVKWFEDLYFNTPGRAAYSPHRIKAMLVRNKTGGAVVPGQVIELDPDNPYEILRTAQTVNGAHAVVDYYLPSAGCPANDVCWVTIAGPCIANVIPGAGANINAGDYLGTDSTSMGVLIPQTIGATTAVDAFNCAVNNGWLMVDTAKTASTVAARVYIRSKYSAGG